MRTKRARPAGNLAWAVAEFRRSGLVRNRPCGASPRVRSRRYALRSREQLRAAIWFRRGEFWTLDGGRLSTVSRRADHLDLGRLRHVAGTLRRRRFAQISAREPGPEPQANGARPCRHLLFAPGRSDDSARGDDGRACACLAAGESAVCRDFVLLAGADPAGARHPQVGGRAAADPPAVLFYRQPLDRAWTARHTG